MDGDAHVERDGDVAVAEDDGGLGVKAGEAPSFREIGFDVRAVERIYRGVCSACRPGRSDG